jgi:hypothetical protein
MRSGRRLNRIVWAKRTIPGRPEAMDGFTPQATPGEKDKWRHLVENFFCKLKEFKRIAMRACKTDESFAAMICLAAAVIRTR